jgi:hypothetical protein
MTPLTAMSVARLTTSSLLALVLGVAVFISTPSEGAAQVNQPPAADPTRPAARPAPALPVPAVGPPIRRISSATAVSTEELRAITSVREIGDGRVLLNDGFRRRLLLMDTSLALVKVVLDSLTEVSNAYGTRSGTLLPYKGDSSLFIDPASLSMLVIDPAGEIVKVRSVPRAEDVNYLGSTSYGYPNVDARGRLVYRKAARPEYPLVAPPRGVPYFPPEPDSAFIVAIDLDSRNVDTLGAIRIPKQDYSVRQMASGGYEIISTINPLPSFDEWTVRSDGVVGLVRGRDYRIDWLHPDGTTSSSPKIPYEWQRVTDEDKLRIVDSVSTAVRRSAQLNHFSAMIRWTNQYNQAWPKDLETPENYTMPSGFRRDWILPPGVSFPANYWYGCAPGEEPVTPTPAGGAAGASSVVVAGGGPPVAAIGGAAASRPSCLQGPSLVAGGPVPPAPTLREAKVVPASALPDYRPPFMNGAVRSDADGNLWIRTVPAQPIPGGFVYDIINSDGQLVDRLQVPAGYTIVGFGKGNVVYLSIRDATGLKLARVKLIRD